MTTVSLKSPAGKWVMVSTILASAMAFIDGTALNVVLPALQKSLNASGTDLFWILNAYLLILASLMLIGGSLGDKLGRKKVFMVGISVFLIGSAACGFSGSVIVLVVCRIIQGIGGALMIPGSLSLISASINKEEKGKAIGTWSAFTTIIMMAGPILGGALADAGLWRYIFFINLPIGVIALLMLWLRVDEKIDDHADHTIDYPGAIAITLGLASLTFGFLRVPAVGWQSWHAYGPLFAGIVLLIIFIIIQRKSKHPMMPLQLFNNLTFSGANLLSFFLYAGLGAGMLFLSLNFVQIQGYSQLQSGLTFLPFTLLIITIARFAGSLADKYGPRLFLIFGPAVAGTGLFMLSFIKQTEGPSAYWTTFFPGILVFGLGMSFTVAPLTTTVMSSADALLSGVASGINNAVTRIAAVFANAIFGALAVLFFSGALAEQVRSIKLDDTKREVVMAQAINLGGARVPPGLFARDQEQVKKAYRQSFISAYRNIMRISGTLGLIGGLMGFVFVRNMAIKKAGK